MKVHWLYAVLLALNLAGFPLLAAISETLGLDSTPISIGMRAGMLAISILLVLLAVFRRQLAFLRGWYWLPFFMFWGAYALRLLYDTAERAGLLSRPPQTYWIWAMGACFLPTLALLTKTKSDAYSMAYRMSLLMLFVAGVLALEFGSTEVFSGMGQAYDSGRFRLESLNPISLGNLGVSLLLLSVWPLIAPNRKATAFERLQALLGGGLGLYLAIASASRGPLVSMILVVLFYALSLDFRRTWRPVLVLALVLTVGFFMAVRFDESGQFQTLARIVSMTSNGDITVSLREQSLTGALKQFADSPIIGDALEERSTHFYPHNLVVESFMATGVIGGIPFALLFVFGVRSAYRLVKRHSVQAWIALVFVQYLASSQFSGSLYASTTLWTVFGATVSLSPVRKIVRTRRLGSSESVANET